MWNGMKKAVTFSYDDGVTQDRRLIKIFDKYGLKATFNLNSGLLGTANLLVREDVTVSHCKSRACEVKEIYKNHEIAAHTLTHPSLPRLSDEDRVEQVEKDRLALSELAGYEVLGMAYPGGGPNCDERVADIVKNRTGIKYARTVYSSHSFGIPENLIMLKPTVHHHTEWDEMLRLAKEFISLETDEPELFYIWGHSYEFDIRDDWDRFEEFCRFISGRSDIYYCTNREALL